MLAPPPERLVQFGGVDAGQPDQLIGHDDGVAVDDLGGAVKQSLRPCGVKIVTTPVARSLSLRLLKADHQNRVCPTPTEVEVIPAGLQPKGSRLTFPRRLPAARVFA
jgi:hypothetical protein